MVPDPNIFLWIAASVSDATAVNSNGIKTLLANGSSTFPIKGNPDFSNGPKTQTKYPPHCLILCNWVFDDFILPDEPFPKDLQSFGTYVLVNNNLWGKLFWSLESPSTVDEIFKVTSVLFFILGFNLLSCKLNSFLFKML